jgi:hypothetical protein
VNEQILYLIRFTYSGQDVWINPRRVVSVRQSTGNLATPVVILEMNQGQSVRVDGKIEDVVKQLIKIPNRELAGDPLGSPYLE